MSGSGAQDRDETIFGHKPFWVIADYLARRGIATLRLDDRGVGESQGDFTTATTLDFAADAESALGFLKRIPWNRSWKIGIRAQRGWDYRCYDGLRSCLSWRLPCCWPGPGVSGEELLYQQQAALAEAYGLGPEVIQGARAIK